MIRWERELARLNGVVRVERTNGGHYRLVLVNGASTITSFSPSDRRTIYAIKKQIETTIGREVPITAVSTKDRRRRRRAIKQQPIHVSADDRPPTPQPRQDFVEVLRTLREQMRRQP